MEETGVVVDIRPRHGRGPAFIKLASGIELSTFNPEVVKTASFSLNKTVTVTYEEKVNPKDEKKPYRNLLTIVPKDAPESQEALESPSNLQVIPQRVQAELVPKQAQPAWNGIQQLEQSFALAIRQRELLEDFIRSRFKEGTHYSDGKLFRSDKPALLQPGAQLILYAHGYAADFEVLSGLPASPESSERKFTLVCKAFIKNRAGDVVGTAMGSADSHIWSGTQAKHVPRGADADKTYNTTLKISQKRALVAACRLTTAASEFFAEDLLDEVGTETTRNNR